MNDQSVPNDVLHLGEVVSYEPRLGFGYVYSAGLGTFIFLVGRAITHRDAQRLRVGARARFALVSGDRVERLVVD